MNNVILAGVIIVAAAAVIVGALYYNKWRKKAKLIPDVEVFSDVIQTTPLGAMVASKTGVSDEVIRIIDRELSELFLDAAALNWTNWMEHNKYIIYVLHTCVPSPVDHVLSFKVRADNYDGTVYDVDPRTGIGYVYAAERVLLVGEVPTGEYIVCNDLSVLPNSVRFGPEHILAYYNDRSYYEETKTHTSVGHPIVPRRTGT